MQTGNSVTGLIIEDIIESMLENEPTSDSDQAKQAIEGFRTFTNRLSHGMSLLIHHPNFSPFFATGVQAAKNDTDTLQMRFGLSNEQMAGMYEYGTSLYSEAKYTDASDVMMCLCLFNPFVAGFWNVLGLSQEGEKDFMAAILSYAVALERDDDLNPALFTARCLGQLGHRAEAIEAIDQAGQYDSAITLAKTYKTQAESDIAALAPTRENNEALSTLSDGIDLFDAQIKKASLSLQVRQ
jgi:tetratricopeptide (TPR) repeat protein